MAATNGEEYQRKYGLRIRVLESGIGGSCGYVLGGERLENSTDRSIWPL